ncbi:MAG: EscU/YscU/HrcU family type III secretion system export apparatus switch protein [Pseudomonadota bacterium]
MSGSEEKTLPPSEKKLRDARKKGQVPQFNDITVLLSFIGGMIFLALTGTSHIQNFSTGLQSAIRALPGQEVGVAAAGIGTDMLRSSMSLVIGLTVTMFLVRMVVVIVLNKGFIFSLDPLSPKLSKLDPIKGIARIFGVRGMVEVAKATFKMIIGILVSIIIFRAFSASIINSISCGLNCQFSLLIVIMMIVFISLILFGLLVSLPDVKLQEWLFSREMKMSRSEQKRESKDMNGSPEIRAARNRLRHSMRDPAEKKIQAKHANLAIIGGGQITLIRYVKGATAVPMIIDKGANETARGLLAEVEGLGIPLFAHPDLAVRVNSSAGRGEPIHPATYAGVADALAWVQTR